MNRLIKWSLHHTVSVIIVTILVLVFGLYALQQIKYETFPEVTIPTLSVQLKKQGYSAEDIQQKITQPVEDVLQEIPEIKEFASTSAENAATLVVNYPMGTDIEKAKAKLEERLNKVQVPQGTEQQILDFDFESIPIYMSTFSAVQTDRLQQQLQDRLVPTLKKIDGVGDVQLIGTNTTSIEIRIDREKAQQYGLNLQMIRDYLKHGKNEMPLGMIDTNQSKVAIRLTADLKNLSQLREMEIKPSRHFYPVKLSEIATFHKKEERKQISRYNGKASFSLHVIKEKGANSAEVGEQVNQVVHDFAVKNHLQPHVILDQGKVINQSIDTLAREGGFGILFTILVIAFFLRNLRATLIAVISLPLSILATMIILNQFGYTLNVMTLGGIAVAVGRIVDDSIVVIENIFRWCQKEHGKRRELAYRATAEVGKAVAASTFVTVVVFLPIAFVEGTVGTFFRPFAVAVVTSILVSWLVAFFLIPVLASSAFQNVPRRAKEAWLARVYRRSLAIALRFRKTVLLASVALLITSIGLLGKVGVSFLPAEEASSIALQVKLSSKHSFAQTDAVSRKIEQMVRSFPAITASQLTIDSEKGTNPLWEKKQENEAHFTLTVKKGTQIDPLLKQLQQRGEAIVQQTDRKGIFIAKEQVTEGPPTGNNLEIHLYGEQAKDLEQAAQIVEQKLSSNPQLKSVENRWNEVRPIWNISLKEKAKKEITPAQLSRAVVERLQPMKVGDFHLDGQDQPLELIYDQGVNSRAELEELEIQTAKGWKELGKIATIQQKNVPVSIKHQDGKKVAQVTAMIKGKDVVRTTQQVMQQLEKLPLPDGVEMQVGGGLEEIKEGFSNLGMAIVMAVGLVFLLLSIAFHGLKTPLFILSSLLFVPSGAILAILWAGQALTVSSMIGLLMLIGIVVTNAIVLVDRIETNQEKGMEQLAAIQEAAKTRLRPILMTALATIFALLPLALSTHSKELISKDLAIAVIGGLTTSTLLTLFVIPVLYAMFRKQKTTINFDSAQQAKGT